ncbi:MAG: hypothetical protein K2Q34_01240 [Alphaproteobacteria bacterium]|nr:hypothetical protein [Alphaproteobacteria bacterium]
MPHVFQLGDLAEGTTPGGEYTTNPYIDEITPWAKAFRTSYFVSCWHMNDEKMPNMWDDFLPHETPDDSIVIKTTLGSLQKCLSPFPIEIGRVKYINHKTESLPTREDGFPGCSNVYSWIMTKDRGKCSWENEIRVVASGAYGPLTIHTNLKGHYFYAPSIDLHELIHQIHCHPNASEARKNEIEALFRPAIFPSLKSHHFYLGKNLLKTQSFITAKD